MLHQMKVLVTASHFLGDEESYGPCFECPKCGKDNFVRGTRFCRGCGVEVLFCQTIKDAVK
jgi:predicted RNA-binding Zn-ribbon protein involved in translation (DUF1610 family)